MANPDPKHPNLFKKRQIKLILNNQMKKGKAIKVRKKYRNDQNLTYLKSNDSFVSNRAPRLQSNQTFDTGIQSVSPIVTTWRRRKLRSNYNNSEIWKGLQDKIQKKKSKLKKRSPPILDLHQTVWGLNFLNSDQYNKKDEKEEIEEKYLSLDSRYMFEPAITSVPSEKKLNEASPNMPAIKDREDLNKTADATKRGDKNLLIKARINKLDADPHDESMRKTKFKYIEKSKINMDTINQRIDDLISDPARCRDFMREWRKLRQKKNTFKNNFLNPLKKR
ncbi:unnamed protein product [Moneuplotes crassus]|uniref:Uncharacterized protein n=1 Tax=Euplotes crassus TaxID=5936 RepID=A0AAD1XE31_EUPCR|nr:unnamed protein product [Moneuplotes crassus]